MILAAALTCLAQPIPFDAEGHYTGDIDISIRRDVSSSATLIEARGARITLTNFHGEYEEVLHTAFGDRVIPRPDEEEDLLEIFGSAKAMENYGSRHPEGREKVEERLELDASRPACGNVFTGLAIVDQETGKVIGRIAIGSGREEGDAQLGLILHEQYQGHKIGSEAVCLAAALASVYLEQQYEVPRRGHAAPVRRFTATVLDADQIVNPWLQRLGMERIRSARPEENYNSKDPRSFYAIDAARLAEVLPRLIGDSRVHVTIE